jgi:hypothetical protein
MDQGSGKLLNLAKMCPNKKIVLDFENVPLVSSSFADEVIGKLFIELGPLAFMQRFQLQHVDQTVRHLVDRAIAQRLAVGGSS